MKWNAFYPGKLFLLFAVISILMVLAGCSTTYSTTPTAPPPAPSTTTTTAPAPSTTTAVPSPAASPSATSASVSLTVNTASKTGIGNYLVDSKGMTLYYFAKDLISKSNAAGAILQSWPIFNAGSFQVPSSLNAADFGTITRDDGQKQSTYKGWPLYYFAKDQAPGDILGEGVGGVWFVLKAPFYTLMLQSKTDVGNYLVDARGRTLYYFTKDSVGKSNATPAILANWPPFYVSSFVLPSTWNVSDFGTIMRDEGQQQTTYKGWPLYYFAKDQVSGDTLGQGVGGIWFVINPANFPPTPTASSTPPASTTPPPTTSSRSGY